MQLFCRNKSCPAQLNKKLEHFAKTLGIKGLGPKTIEKLELDNIYDIYQVSPRYFTECLGEKLATKLVSEIETSKNSSLNKVIAAFSIPLIGGTASDKLTRIVQTIEEITPKTCKDAGLGDKATANLINWLETEFLEIRPFLPFSFTSTNSDKQVFNKTICITGKLTSYKTKAEAAEALKPYGFLVVESLTKSTDYLADETSGTSTKRKKAEELGIPIINNLKNFLKEIEIND
jgi:NAD-dependent DNA ligase